MALQSINQQFNSVTYTDDITLMTSESVNRLIDIDIEEARKEKWKKNTRKMKEFRKTTPRLPHWPEKFFCVYCHCQT